MCDEFKDIKGEQSFIFKNYIPPFIHSFSLHPYSQRHTHTIQKMSTPEQPSAPAASTTNSSNRKPKVIIAGGGLGGLTLAILLHKANIDFEVLERAKEVKPLGEKKSTKSWYLSHGSLYFKQ